ncbi:Polycomb protein, VEFS-Box [Artemisia annua]|uniref:Polycomb protein, VEFS-Box n=1 Tax=Artemisia annua TaxID=35608 RepID=A0A2U1KIU0_ARTAN|nr:Polycomb protein, VEFS-Box [Artemisia annua]
MDVIPYNSRRGVRSRRSAVDQSQIANHVGQLVVASDMPATLSSTNAAGAQSAPGSNNVGPSEILLREPPHPTKYVLCGLCFLITTEHCCKSGSFFTHAELRVSANRFVKRRLFPICTNAAGAQSAPGSNNVGPSEILLREPPHPTKYVLCGLCFLITSSRTLLQKRQFFHSRGAQKLNALVGVTDQDKHFMHLWDSFTRKQRVVAVGHIPWECKAFLTEHGKDLVGTPLLTWYLFPFMYFNGNESLNQNFDLIVVNCVYNNSTLHAYDNGTLFNSQLLEIHD